MSKEHIEREATCKDCFHYDVCANPCTKYYYRVPCRKFVNSADVVPVVHGEWIPIVNCFHGKPDGRYYCSVCHRVETTKGIYCRLCGARMDGGNSND